MKDIMGLMKQAKDMQAKMEDAQSKVADLVVTGKSGGGLVQITLSGGHNVKALKIDPSLATEDDIEILEDLIIAAFQDAKIKLDEAQADMMKDAFGGFELPPGMKLPF